MPAKAHAILLAAGRGERMRPLTDTCPKPLLKVRGKPLMQWPMEALARGGFQHLVINTAWLGDQIEQAFGSGAQITPALSLAYSHEGHDFGGALETAGGIVRALPLLEDVFWVLAGDVFAPDFAFHPLAVEAFKTSGHLAHIWLAPNPAHNPLGDFGLGADGLALNLPRTSLAPKFTYSTIGLYRSALFSPPYCAIKPGNTEGAKAALAPILRAAMDAGRVSAELYQGLWTDVGTPERLQALNQSENAPSQTLRTG